MTTVAAGLRGSAVLPVLAGVGLLAGATAAGIGALSLADALTATGLPDPGPVTTYGLPFVRAAGEIAAVLAVGSFLFAAFHAAAAGQRCPRCRRLPGASPGHGGVGGVGDLRGDARPADRLRRLRAAAE